MRTINRPLTDPETLERNKRLVEQIIERVFVNGEDGAIERQGYYGLFAYKLRPEIEAVVRFDSWDPDTARDAEAATVRERDYLAGVNYYLHGNKAKLQLNVLQKTFAEPVLPDRHLILLNLQTSW